MGSFKGHLLPGSMFIMVGLWHLFNSILNYVAHPRTFRGRVWHPVRGAKGKLKYTELYIIAVGSFVDMCIEFFYSTHMKFIVDGELNPTHMNDFEHAAMLLMFFIFFVTCILNESTGLLSLPEGALYVIAAMAFTAEYLLFYFHSTNHAGMEGRYHKLLVLLIGLCIVFSLLGAAFPESFLIDLSGGLVITLQGLWFYQTAFTLYGPLMPTGCTLKPSSDIVCDAPEFEIRAQSLANSQLSAHVVGLLTVVLMFYAIAARVWGHHDLYDRSRVTRRPSQSINI
ncbi:unnamed protein product [Calypogeia fissa]